MLHDYVGLKQNRMWAIVILIALVVGVCSTYILGPDNKIEEVAEMVIHHVTGIDMDISEGEEDGTD